MEAKFEFTEYLNGQGGCYPYDWKRFLRNMEFDNVDKECRQTMYERTVW